MKPGQHQNADRIGLRGSLDLRVLQETSPKAHTGSAFEQVAAAVVAGPP
jgi:hypothetical protein